MADITRHLDRGSQLIILATFVLFFTALFVKGLGHDILLEAGVLLVSVKLIIITYKNGVSAADIRERLANLERTLVHIDERLQTMATSARSDTASGSDVGRV